MIFLNKSGSVLHGSALCDELKALLIEHEEYLGSSLIPDLSHINSRAENHTGIDVCDVTFLGGNEYQLDYQYQWSVYNGCADMDLEGEEDSCISFTLEMDGELVFDILEVEQRNTLEEF
ncbi:MULTISPECIES: hypothetical protein [Vibrio]|uniref:Uncharacterized protein n=1 Tax=Vibrio tasmaniensis TaxID=212663 RepID=A0A2N7NHQ4_9VIBR|nr:hypothetical protein [Vibrio tasmaniensis]PMP13955.1 hypothetical protein BCS92_14900 [Vibrio tasmaniensis]TKG32170.1 hypothetical protein FC057_13050 [Vibrio tasmaniensis]TKG39626.1 hypothetical protein FC063_14720 [Vibrio tasmaniensis]TKG40720.1 hypothetical protein FC060_23695 [Vibrio tasmaniensis]TKG49956.1 hypothetical protein FC061_13310 [Vibrio tasmaniensis]